MSGLCRRVVEVGAHLCQPELAFAFWPTRTLAAGWSRPCVRQDTTCCPLKTIPQESGIRYVLRIAHEEQRLIMTQDKDFGELAVRLGLPASSGVLLIRIDRGLPHDDAERIVAVVRSRADWSGHFSVVDDERIRMRPLPRKNL